MGRKRTVKKAKMANNMRERLLDDRDRLINYLRILNRELKSPRTDMKLYDFYEKEKLNTILLLVIISTGIKRDDFPFTDTLKTYFNMDYNTYHHKTLGFNFRPNEIYNVIEFLVKHGYSDALYKADHLWHSLQKIETQDI